MPASTSTSKNRWEYKSLRAMTTPSKHTWIVALALALMFIVVYGHVRGYEIQSGIGITSVSSVAGQRAEGPARFSYEATNGVGSISQTYKYQTRENGHE